MNKSTGVVLCVCVCMYGSICMHVSCVNVCMYIWLHMDVYTHTCINDYNVQMTIHILITHTYRCIHTYKLANMLAHVDKHVQCVYPCIHV